MAAVCVLGFLLGLDSLRASLALGASPLGKGQRARIAFTFGLCDGLAPLLGLALERMFVTAAAPWIKLFGVLALGGYGFFLLATTRRSDTPADNIDRAIGIGLPVALGLDNLIAGFGLGTLGLPVVLSAVTLGVISGLMSLIGLWLGRAAGRFVPASAERLGGVALIAVALAMFFD